MVLKVVKFDDYVPVAGDFRDVWVRSGRGCER